MSTENRRIKMTKALLNDSFLNILKKKPLARITVKEICECADVNRSTYYVYYSDPYDQLNKMEQELLNAQTVLVDTILNDGQLQEDNFLQTTTKLLNYYQEKKTVLQVLLGNHGDVHLEYDMLSFFADRVISFFSQRNQLSLELLQDYIYSATGCFGLIRYWIMNECQEPPEILARRISRLTDSIRKVK